MKAKAHDVYMIGKSVCLVTQVNYLGHYTLARLLEPVLIKSAPARIVSVSSATHRYSAIRRVREFLSQTKFAQYGETKFAQVLFTFEAERRLGPLGVHVSSPRLLFHIPIQLRDRMPSHLFR